MTTLPAGLREQIGGLMLADRRRLGRQADQAESLGRTTASASEPYPG